MGIRGPAKQTAAMKALNGSKTAPADGIDFEPLAEAPEKPPWVVGLHATRLWDRLMPMMLANRLMGDAHIEPFGHMCMLHNVLIKQYKKPSGPSSALMSNYIQLCSKFGLTLADASRIKLPGGQPKKNPFEDDDE